MKKILVILLTLCLAISLCACGAKSKKNVTDTKTEETTIVETTVEETTTIEITTKAPVKMSLKGLCAYLEKKGVVSGETDETYAYLIGAKNGIQYLDSDVEIYEYDVNSKEYKTLVKNGKIELEWLDGEYYEASAINGKFVLFFADDSTPNDKVIKAFNSYGK